MGDISSIVGKRIKAHRNRLGFTQEELAEKCGLHHTYIGQLERGEKNATLESIEKVVRGLDISFEVLFEKLDSGTTVEPNIAAKCYEIVSALHPSEQQVMFDIFLKVVEYKYFSSKEDHF